MNTLRLLIALLFGAVICFFASKARGYDMRTCIEKMQDDIRPLVQDAHNLEYRVEYYGGTTIYIKQAIPFGTATMYGESMATLGIFINEDCSDYKFRQFEGWFLFGRHNAKHR